MPVAYNKPSDDTKYCLESARLESFDDGWTYPADSYCSKDNMATAGLYFLGYDDVVKCFACHVKMQDWDPYSDEPWLKHKEISPKCTFAKFGTREGLLTVEQWIDVMCCRAISLIDQRLAKFKLALSEP